MQSEPVESKDTRGKHRISAELKRLEQETRFLQEELELLDKLERHQLLARGWKTML